MNELAPPIDASEEPEGPLPSRRGALYRVLFLAFVLIGFWVIGYFMGITDDLSVDRVRVMITNAGIYGVLVFIALFIVGQIFQVPGLVFVAAAVFAWGWAPGGALSIGAGTIAVVVNFAILKRIGGNPLSVVRKPWVKKILAKLHERPLLTVLILRGLFLTSPPMSIAFALSGMRHRDHALGSAVGMGPLIMGWSYAFSLGFTEFGFL